MTHQSCKIRSVYKTLFHKSGHIYVFIFLKIYFYASTVIFQLLLTQMCTYVCMYVSNLTSITINADSIILAILVSFPRTKPTRSASYVRTHIHNPCIKSLRYFCSPDRVTSDKGCPDHCH